MVSAADRIVLDSDQIIALAILNAVSLIGENRCNLNNLLVQTLELFTCSSNKPDLAAASKREIFAPESHGLVMKSTQCNVEHGTFSLSDSFHHHVGHPIRFFMTFFWMPSMIMEAKSKSSTVEMRSVLLVNPRRPPTVFVSSVETISRKTSNAISAMGLQRKEADFETEDEERCGSD